MKKNASNVLFEISTYEAPDERPEFEEEARSLSGVTIGVLRQIGDSGEPRIDFQKNPDSEPQPARSIVRLSSVDIGKEVVLSFEEGDRSKPIVLGLIQSTPQRACPASDRQEAQQAVAMEIDGEKITLTGRKEVVLRCGKASITLTRAGKVILRGAYILSRASGVNRVKGGSVQLN